MSRLYEQGQMKGREEEREGREGRTVKSKSGIEVPYRKNPLVSLALKQMRELYSSSTEDQQTRQVVD